LPPETKNQVSHRARASQAALLVLKAMLDSGAAGPDA
jgi:hypothetical protein